MTRTALVTKVMWSNSVLGHWMTFKRLSIMPQETRASPPASKEAKWYKKLKRAVAKGCGNALLLLRADADDLVVNVIEELVNEAMQFLTMTGRKP